LSLARLTARTARPVARLITGESSGGGVVTFDFYVDSVNGSDSNDGLTPATARQTIASAMTLLSAGKKLGLARGSKWRETFIFQHANLSIGVYGTGNPPIFDGRNVVTATWTQPDIVNFPDVWSVSWTRAQAATTGVAWVNLWADNTFVRAASSLADLQANGGAFYANRTATTTTISIKSTTNPNNNGVVYEISTRGWAFRGHSTALGSAAPANQQVVGPIECTGFIEHYNALAGGPGQSKQLLLTDGNIHHTVTEGDLTEDVLMSRVIPGASGSLHVAYRVVGTGFSHTARRCLALSEIFAGLGRNGHSGFYAHGSTPASIDSYTVDQCLMRMCTVSADASLLNVTNLYASGAILAVINTSSTNVNVNINRVQIQDTTPQSSALFRSLTSPPVIAIENLCGNNQSGFGMIFTGLPSTPPSVTRCAIVNVGGAITGGAGASFRASLTLNYSIVIATGGRVMDNLQTPYVGDYNVFRGTADNQPVFSINAAVSSSFANWQTISGGQDLNSVWLKASDQTAGNANAFWLGISTNANAGPVDGDWRINPAARAYNAAGAALTGTFADGVTPLTLAGPQEHWNYNTRSVVAGPPTRLVRLPESKAEERQYIEDPAAWNFYP